MKFLFVGDPHNQVRTPSNRVDAFHTTYQKKVEEIKQIAKDEQVKAILQPGDFLNSPQYNNDFIMKVVRQWSFVPEKYELLEDLRQGKGEPQDIALRLQEDIPYIGAIGNHELIGESLKSYQRTSLAFLEEIGFMKMASREEPIIFTDDDGTKVAITATHYHHGMDEPEHVNDYIIDEKAGDIHIHMVHGYLAHINLGDLITHTLVDAVKETKADVTLAGHDHVGFSPVEIDGKLFANPGSMTRTKADVKEIARKPKVIIIEVKDGKVSLEERMLKSAEEGEKVLDRTSILKRASKASKIESIKSIVNKAKLSKGQSVTDIIKAVADAETIEKDITNDVVSRVTDKMEEMGHSETASVPPYKLSQIILENFQSHKHSVFDVSKELNIFTGESSNGKSAVMRAMRWLMDNNGKSQRDTFIRHGADFAKVTAVFDTGKMVSRIIHQQEHKDNGWEIFDPMTGETHSGNTRMIDEVRELFGFTKVKYDVKDELDVNFLNQGEGWYFIGDHVPASKRAKIIGAIFGTHYTDAVMRDLEKELRQVRQESRVREDDLEKTQKKIDEFNYLEKVEEALGKAEELIGHLNTLNERKEKISQLIEKQERLDNQKEAINKVLEATKDLDKANKKLHELEVLNNRYEHIVDLITKAKNIILSGKTCRAISNKLEHIDSIREKYELLGDKYKTYVHINELVEQSNIVSKEIKSTKEVLNNLQHMRKVKEKVKQLESLKETYQVLVNIMLLEEDVRSRMINERKTKMKSEKFSLKLQEEYKSLLDEYGQCPTCGQSINNETLDSHLVHAY